MVPLLNTLSYGFVIDRLNISAFGVCFKTKIFIWYICTKMQRRVRQKYKPRYLEHFTEIVYARKRATKKLPKGAFQATDKNKTIEYGVYEETYPKKDVGQHDTAERNNNELCLQREETMANNCNCDTFTRFGSEIADFLRSLENQKLVQFELKCKIIRAMMLANQRMKEAYQ